MNLPKFLLHLSVLSLIGISAPIAEANYRPKKVGRYNGPAIPTGTRSACDNTQSPHRLTPIAPSATSDKPPPPASPGTSPKTSRRC